MNNKYDSLKLENQLCFPLYAASKATVHKSSSYLQDLGLSYTQYIVMMILWERKCISLKEIGKMLFLDSGTLTPVLKTLEKKGYVERKRSKDDERILTVTITKDGENLKKQALEIPKSMSRCMALSDYEFNTLYKLLYKLLYNLEADE